MYEDGRATFIAVNDADVALGFADLERDGHLGFLYVDPFMTGRGIASELLSEVIGAAQKEEIDRIFAEASAVAVRTFEKHGFRRGDRREFKVAGVPMHNYSVSLEPVPPVPSI